MPSLPTIKKGGELVNCDKMTGGFSFCGVDIKDLGLGYAPENEQTYVYRPAEINIHEETFDGHDGGYFYGITRQPKEFNLRCFFEDKVIDQGFLERVYNLFRLGRSGKLVFSRRPWCYYYATVTSIPHPELYDFRDGLITITMKAYYPFARSDEIYYTKNSIDFDLAMKSTALLEKKSMSPAVTFQSLTSRTEFVLLNPGTEETPVTIIASGNSGDGIIIRNKTTNQECHLVVMGKADTTDLDKAVQVNGMTGETKLIYMDNTSTPPVPDLSRASSPAYFYHDSGFISLAPAYPAIRNIFTQSAEDDVLTLVNILHDNVVGQYIYTNNKWHKIIGQDGKTLQLDENITFTRSERTMIVKMNELEIVPDNTMSIDYLSFVYKPAYA